MYEQRSIVSLVYIDVVGPDRVLCAIYTPSYYKNLRTFILLVLAASVQFGRHLRLSGLENLTYFKS